MNSSTIDRIREATNLVEVVGRYVQLKKNGSRYIGLCPFHKDKKTPSFSINNDLWICFGCRAGGNVFQFLQQIEGIPFPQALEQLSQETGIGLTNEGRRPITMAGRVHDSEDANDAAFFWNWAHRQYAGISDIFFRFDRQACAFYATRDTDTAEAAFWLTLGPTVQDIMHRKIERITTATPAELADKYKLIPKPLQDKIRSYRTSLIASERALLEIAGRE
jgi:DNA primase catalytic core